MKQNLDALDRIFRFALAFWWLGPWAPTFPADWANLLVLIAGWIALVESFWGYCWLQETLGIHH